ncbi:MAG: tetratricopeptide repeat protein [bacterium]
MNSSFRKKTFFFIISAIFLFAGLNSPGRAAEQSGFRDGMEAYKEQNYKKAFRLWHSLAEKGHAKAQYNLAILYIQGNGTSKNPREAAKWLRKSAKQGHANAQYNLGLMFLNGEGVKKSDKEAIKWFRKAAEQDDGLAQYNLAAMYVYGKGVRKDYVKAHMWSNLAARQGNKDAEKARDDIARNMTPEQIINARLLAREWKSRNKKKKGTKKEF